MLSNGSKFAQNFDKPELNFNFVAQEGLLCESDF